MSLLHLMCKTLFNGLRWQHICTELGTHKNLQWHQPDFNVHWFRISKPWDCQILAQAVMTLSLLMSLPEAYRFGNKID